MVESFAGKRSAEEHWGQTLRKREEGRGGGVQGLVRRRPSGEEWCVAQTGW